MQRVIDRVAGLAFAITPSPLFDRIWCLWEYLCASRSQKECHILHGIGHQQDMYRIENATFESFRSVASAKATIERDKTEILNEIVRHFGSIEEADEGIRDLIRQCPRLYPERRKQGE